MRQIPYFFFILLFCSAIWSCDNEAKKQKKRQTDSLARRDSINKVNETKGKKTILFLGNSLTFGYGLDDPQENSFPALIQKRIDSLLLPYKVINAGLSGETTTGGRERINWLLKQKVDIMVLELGGNDGLRGQSTKVMEENLQEIMDIARRRYKKIKILLAGMEAPPNMGPQYTTSFRNVYKTLAEKNEAVTLIPFILEGVGGKPELNQNDGIHPTGEGHQIMANTVWKYLEKFLEK
ncbi:MAG TPA: arylesterase [Microscillaceae bacterium]|nr:arylesterase [Microscillaceae bacterium]